MIFCKNHNKDGKFFALKEGEKWYRGARLWRWTKYLKCAAQIDSKGYWEYWVIPLLLQKGHQVSIVEFERINGQESIISETVCQPITP